MEGSESILHHQLAYFYEELIEFLHITDLI